MHDGFRDRTVVLDELGTQVEVENVAAVIETGKRLIDLKNFPALRAERLAARKDAEQDDFCVRLADANLLHDGGYAFENFSLGVVLSVGIVGSDHDDGDFGFDAVKLPLFESPENILRLITVDGEVDDLALAVKFLPYIPARVFPPLSDGVSDEFNVVVTGSFFGAIEHKRLAISLVIGARHRNDGGVFVNFLAGREVAEHSQNENCKKNQRRHPK